MIFKVIMVAVMCSGCTITVTPIKKTAKVKQKSHRVVKHKSKPTPNGTIVDHDWLIQYRQLEEEHGYPLRDDIYIESVGGGKYRVTPTMLKHFKDLSQVPTPP